MRTRQHEQLSVETNEEREARLQQMRTRQHERLSVETNEEREARLQQTRTCQHERLSVEANEEREDRLQRASERDREQQSQLMLFEQHSVQQKIRPFYITEFGKMFYMFRKLPGTSAPSPFY